MKFKIQNKNIIEKKKIKGKNTIISYLPLSNHISDFVLPFLVGFELQLYLRIMRFTVGFKQYANVDVKISRWISDKNKLSEIKRLDLVAGKEKMNSFLVIPFVISHSQFMRALKGLEEKGLITMKNVSKGVYTVTVLNPTIKEFIKRMKDLEIEKQKQILTNINDLDNILDQIE